MTSEILFASLFLSVLIIIVLIIINRRENKHVQKLSNEKIELENLKKKEIKEYFKKEWSEEERNLEDKIRIKREGAEKSFKDKIDFLEANLKEKEKRYNEVNQDLNLYKEGKIKEIDSAAAEYEQRKQLEIKQLLQQHEFQANSDGNNHVDSYTIQKAQMQSEIKEIKAELEVERSKRAAINEEIRREQLLVKEKDAHRIILSDEDKEDIAFLTTILSKINHKETLYKLIWSEYLIKPYQNMIKQLFGSKVPKNVIYCIESLDGKYKYIGKTSADVSKRWSEHIKTSLNIGGVSRSKVHDALYLHWDEFTFSILEETTKECLSEREKYYIRFFESDKYGLNIKSGG